MTTCDLQTIGAVLTGELGVSRCSTKSINAGNYTEEEDPPGAPKSEETSGSQRPQLTRIDPVKRTFPARTVHVPASLHHRTGPSVLADPGSASNS